MPRLYPALAYLLAPAYAAALLGRGFRERGYWKGFPQRLGFGAALRDSLWVHAASVGEVQAAAALVRALRARRPGAPLIVTTSTPAGAARARALFGAGAEPGRESARDADPGITPSTDVRFVPLDVPGAVRRFFERARPRLAIVMETELWPSLFRECRRRGIPLVIASARLSERSVRRYALLSGLAADTLSYCTLIAAQTEADATRFRQLGAPVERTHVTGNIKFDLEISPAAVERGRAMRERQVPHRPQWVAGSTHEGEERAVMEAHALVRRRHPDALLVLAPRHPPRFPAVAALLEQRGIRFVRRSSGEAPGADTGVLLLDSVGELVDFYAAADVVFVGGSLVPIGGHNLLEPAALGRPTLTGPHNFNAPDVARLLIERGGVEVVSDASRLGARVAELLANASERETMGACALAVVEENRGALERLLELMEPLLVR